MAIIESDFLILTQKENENVEKSRITRVEQVRYSPLTAKFVENFKNLVFV